MARSNLVVFERLGRLSKGHPHPRSQIGRPASTLAFGTRSGSERSEPEPRTLSGLSARDKSSPRVSRSNGTRQQFLPGRMLRIRGPDKGGRILMKLKKPFAIAAIVGGSFGLGLGGAAIAALRPAPPTRRQRRWRRVRPQRHPRQSHPRQRHPRPRRPRARTCQARAALLVGRRRRARTGRQARLSRSNACVAKVALAFDRGAFSPSCHGRRRLV